MTTKQQSQNKTNEDDYLYEEALTSLKKLNQDVFLNDLNEQIKGFTQNVSQDISELQTTLKDEIQFTTLSVNSTIEALKDYTDKSKENLEEQDHNIRGYFTDFFNYFNDQISSTVNQVQTSNELFIKEFAKSMQHYEENLQRYNDRHEVFYEAFEKENTKLEHLVESFKESTIGNISMLKEIRKDWLVSIDQLQTTLTEKIDFLQRLNEEHCTFISKSNETIVSELEKNNERNENIMNQHEQNQLMLKNELEQTIENFKAFLTDINEQHQIQLQTSIENLNAENTQLKTKLQEQTILIKSNQNTNSIFSIILGVMIIALIILQFVK